MLGHVILCGRVGGHLIYFVILQVSATPVVSRSRAECTRACERVLCGPENNAYVMASYARGARHCYIINTRQNASARGVTPPADRSTAVWTGCYTCGGGGGGVIQTFVRTPWTKCINKRAQSRQWDRPLNPVGVISRPDTIVRDDTMSCRETRERTWSVFLLMISRDCGHRYQFVVVVRFRDTSVGNWTCDKIHTYRKDYFLLFYQK